MHKTIGAMVLAALCLGVTTPAGAISGNKLLQKLKLVDGDGSGLDADTVRGKTPEQIAGDAAAAAAGAVGHLLASAYSVVNVIQVDDGFCNSVDVRCDEGDFLLNCGALINPSSGELTQSGELLDIRACRAGGCAIGAPAGLAVTATCLKP